MTKKGTSPEADALSQALTQLNVDVRKTLEYHFLGGYSLEKAYQMAGIGDRYDPSNGYKIKLSKYARVYIKHLQDRQLVVGEFGVDEPKAISLVKMRDEAFKSGDITPAIRAHELILKLIGNLGGKSVVDNGKRKAAIDMTKDEIIARLASLQLEATGESLGMPKDSVDAEFEELVSMNQLPPASDVDGDTKKGKRDAKRNKKQNPVPKRV